MTAVYIIGSIVLFITFIVMVSRAIKKSNYSEWLLELNQWEIDDIVEIIELEQYPKEYYNPGLGEKFNSNEYHHLAKDQYEKKYPNNTARPIVNLVKWDENNCEIKLANNKTIYMSTKFIKQNITFEQRKVDKGMDTFVLSKKEKIQKLRKQKLIRILETNS